MTNSLQWIGCSHCGFRRPPREFLIVDGLAFCDTECEQLYRYLHSLKPGERQRKA